MGWGTPSFLADGVPPSQLWTGGYPSQFWMGGTPFPALDRGVPLPRSGRGVPPPGMGYPPLSRPGMGVTPPPPQSRSRKGGTPRSRPGKGYPPPPPHPRRGQVQGQGVPLPEHCVYLLRIGRYASCVHAGGLSCITEYPIMLRLCRRCYRHVNVNEINSWIHKDWVLGIKN